MRNEKIRIICDGVTADPRSLTDILMFSAERAEFVCRTFLENLPTDEPERSHDVLEAHRNYCLLETIKKDRACSSLLPEWFSKAVGEDLGELREGFKAYIKRYPEDMAARLLSSGAAPTLHGYLATAMEAFDEQHASKTASHTGNIGP